MNPPRSECCLPAPPVMHFDSEGNLLQAWGGPGQGYDWPANEHGIFVGAQNNVWLAGNLEKDNQLLTFTRDGRFLMQIGKPGMSKGDTDTQNLNRPTDTRVDSATNELFVADGYGNHRVIRIQVFKKDGSFVKEFSLAPDTKGNIYTTEVDNAKRAQKFVYQGLFPPGE